MMAAVPTTMASAAVWTRKAGGNDAIPLLNTLISNGFCFLTIPMWLGLMLAQTVEFDPVALIIRLAIVAVLPMTLAQLLRQLPPIRSFANAHRQGIGTAAQLGILTIIAVSALKTGPLLETHQEGVSTFNLLLIALMCLVIHGAGLYFGWILGKLCRQPLPDRIGIAFSGSQKTLPLAVELATSPVLLASGLSPLIILPPLIFHAMQLMMDTYMIAKFSQICSDEGVPPA